MASAPDDDSRQSGVAVGLRESKSEVLQIREVALG